MFKKILLFTLFSLLTFSLVQAESVARVIKSMGDVTLKASGQTEFSTSVTPGLAVNNGDELKVGAEAFAVLIYLDDKSVLKVRENSDFQFVDTENTRTVDMKYGTVYNQISKEGRNKAFRVQTPTSVASVKGTEFWALVDLSGVDQFMGTEGLFEVLNTVSGQIVQVSAGQTAISNALGNLMNTPTTPGSIPVDPDPDTQPGDTGDQQTGDEETQDTGDQTTEETTPDQPTPDTTVPETGTPEEVIPDEGAPEEAGPESAGRSMGMGLGIGSVTIDGIIYNQFAFRPEFKFGKLGLGLDIVLYIDDQGNIHKDEWDEVSDFMDKFLYIRWAEKQDPFWFKLGSLPGVTLGYGGLLNGYSNMMEFPEVRRVGLNLGVNMGKIGTEVLFSNVKDLVRGGTLMGLRTTYKVSKRFPLTFGVNVVADINQFSGLKDRDGDSYPDAFDHFIDNDKYWLDSDGDGLADNDPTETDRDGDGLPDIADEDGDLNGAVISFWKDLENSTGGDFSAYYYTVPDTGTNVSLLADPFSTKDNKSTALGFGADLGYPVFSNKFLALDVFTEFNHLIFPKVDPGQSYFGRPERSGTGITIPGIRASIMKFLHLGVEYRIKQSYYVQNFFDQSYDLSRVQPFYIFDEPYVITKDMLLFSDEASSTNSSGIFGSASADILNIVSFSASYATMKADSVEFNSFLAMVNINTDFIPKLSVASAYYQRNNDPDPFDFGNPSINTILGYKLGYEISNGVSLIWDFRQFYAYEGEELIPQKLTTIETAFSF